MNSRPTSREPIEIPGFIALPLFFVAAALSVPYTAGFMAWLRIRDYRLFKHLRAVHRILPWTQVVQHLSAGERTLLVEQAQKLGHHLWWTPEDVAAVSPVPIPTLDFADYIRPSHAHPFVSWCYQRYLSPASGTAYLTREEGFQFPPGFITSEFLFLATRMHA